jgi:hypothetical protein
MPWYKVPLTVYLPADGPKEAQDAALAMFPAVPDGENRPMASAQCPVELTEEQLAWWKQLHGILRQAERDREEGTMVPDRRYPGVRFTPAAAAELAALEFEERQSE